MDSAETKIRSGRYDENSRCHEETDQQTQGGYKDGILIQKMDNLIHIGMTNLIEANFVRKVKPFLKTF